MHQIYNCRARMLRTNNYDLQNNSDASMDVEPLLMCRRSGGSLQVSWPGFVALSILLHLMALQLSCLLD